MFDIRFNLTGSSELFLNCKLFTCQTLGITYIQTNAVCLKKIHTIRRNRFKLIVPPVVPINVKLWNTNCLQSHTHTQQKPLIIGLIRVSAALIWVVQTFNNIESSIWFALQFVRCALLSFNQQSWVARAAKTNTIIYYIKSAESDANVWA